MAYKEIFNSQHYIFLRLSLYNLCYLLQQLGGGGDYSSNVGSAGWSSGGTSSSGGYNYKRSLQEEDAQKLAYSAYAPENSNSSE